MKDEMDDAMPTYGINPDDLIRVVRCKDCKHYTDGQIKGSEHSYCVKIDAWMKPEDYCS